MKQLKKINNKKNISLSLIGQAIIRWESYLISRTVLINGIVNFLCLDNDS